jgi:tetratricopeptide (TPR) repeat protein
LFSFNDKLRLSKARMIAPALSNRSRFDPAKRRYWGRTLLAGLLLVGPLVAVVLAIYGASVRYEFVYDDHVQIERNPWLHDPDGFRLFLTRPFWGFYRDRGIVASNYYRPVFGAAYSLIARGCGISATAFHAASVALHLAVTLLVAFGARRLIADPEKHAGETLAGALAAGLLFAVYPAHAEAVAWVGGQADLLAALFALISLLAYLALKDGGKGWLKWIGPASYLLACLAKEPGTALLLVLGAVEVSEWRREGTVWTTFKRGAGRLAPYLLVLALYFALRLNALGSFSPRSYEVTASPGGAFAYAAGLLAHYLGFLVVPFPVQLLAGIPAPTLRSPIAIAGLLAAAAIVIGLAAAAWSGRGRREVVVPLAVIVAFVLPVLAANSIGGSNFAERYLYLPSAGLAWLFGSLCARAARRSEVLPVWLRLAAAVAVLGLLGAAGVAAWERAGLYRNDLTLFRATVRVSPDAEIARNNLGMALYNRGRLDEAEREYKAALRLSPYAVPPLANLGVLYERRGDNAKARSTFEQVLRLSPTHAISADHLARILRAQGDRAGADRRLDALFAAGGENYEALTDRAEDYLTEGKPANALPLLARATGTFPEFSRGWGLLARARAAQGDSRGAVVAARRALAIHPQDPDARKALGKASAKQG